MKLKRVSLDLDGVLADFTSGWLKVAHSIWPGRIPFDFQPREWYWSDSGLEHTEVYQVLKKLDETENFWLNLPKLDESIEWGDLEGYALDFYFVTSRGDTKGMPTRAQTELFLYNRYGVRNPTVLVVKSPTAKTQLYEALDIQYSLDDFPLTVQMCNKMLRSHKAVILEQPWNEHERRVYRLESVKNVKEFLQKIS